ncbi:MAG TPA: hypothetical protein VH185_03830 [Mycobacterium sp.]|nr:hypothetical protein [Mycobacterium sp.]
MLSIPRDVGLEPHRPEWVPKPRIAARPVNRRADAWARPAHPADVAQARIFDAILRGEIAELEGLVASMEQRWLRRCERGVDDERKPPEGLVRMRGRVLEAQQLLDALRSRFPSE